LHTKTSFPSLPRTKRKKLKQIRPIYSLFFLLSLFGLFGVMDVVLAKKQFVLWSGVTVKIPSLQSVFEEQQKADISSILAMQDSLEETSLAGIDSTIHVILGDTTDILRHGAVLDSSINVRQPIEYPGNNPEAMCHFFHALANEIHKSRTLRILHYGDSQIEGDRITGYLRKRLQANFGGSGPGFLPISPIAPSSDIEQSWSSNWKRYTCFTNIDKRVPHNQYGAGAAYCRFLPYPAPGDTAVFAEAWSRVKYRHKGKRQKQKIKLFYGNASTKTFVSLNSGGQLILSDSLLRGGNFHISQFELPEGVSDLTMHFQGKDSPDIYGMSLEGQGGILVDNFGLRGSSGTFFNRMDRQQLQAFYDHFHVRLIILQFGGNTLPYTKSKEQAVQYGKYLKAQINTLKKLVPSASILVLGPADMSVKEGTVYVTHPQLEALRDAIRDAAFKTNCAFFDVYEGMGGKNSMVSWVDAGIASKDYIHFMPNGARKIATMLYAAMLQDYNHYIRKQVPCRE
jgi:lysophospholipase L1-like esterase